MARVWEAPIFAIATVYFTVDALFSAITGPITAWLSKKRLLERIRRWVTSLGPYQSFALFAVPLIILEPAKPLSAYFLATGHFLPGALVFIAAEVLKLSVVERLFQLNKKKLLSISLFAWGYGYWRRIMDFLSSTSAWRVTRRALSETLERIKNLRSRLRSRNPLCADEPGQPGRACPRALRSSFESCSSLRSSSPTKYLKSAPGCRTVKWVRPAPDNKPASLTAGQP